MARQSNFTPTQVTMTLAALAATGATSRPSGESLQDQSARILAGISQQLTDQRLATSGTWQPVWLALSPDNANMAYIARNTDGSNEFAVVSRGTTPNLTDISEDLEVGTVVPFTAGGAPQPIAVSAGAMAAFTQIANAPSIVPATTSGAGIPPVGSTLADALEIALQSAPASPQPTVYVTGHSLGGCLATMVAPYLRVELSAQAQFALITFAAPSAGLASFADYVDSVGWLTNERHVNAYDLIPLAWTELLDAVRWYPSPGPTATWEIEGLLAVLISRTNGHTYAQPGSPLKNNEDYKVLRKSLVNNTTADFLGQVAFQHANSTYLGLLDAPLIAPGPVVLGISPTSGGAGTTVKIGGIGFTADSVVDFGPIACGNAAIDSDTLITATVPAGTGIVDVRVTNVLGTSPVVPIGQFAYGGPAPVVVRQIGPNSGQVGTHVTIQGSGFAAGATVSFNRTPALAVDVESPVKITATVPKLPDDSRTANVTVTVGVATSPTSPAGEFTYTGAIST